MDENTKVLFFDTETSDFIKKALTATDPDQAWCVQIGAILATQKEEIEMLNLMVQANGREMNYYAQQVHGITIEQADEEGLPELEVAEKFGKMLRKADLLVCHNFDFDWKYVYQMMERNLDKLSDEARSAFYLDLPSFCTMKDKTVKKYVNAKNKNGRIKWPKLIELHERIENAYFAKHGEKWKHSFTEDDAHDAFADIKATKNCFFELVNLGIIELNVPTTSK